MLWLRPLLYVVLLLFLLAVGLESLYVPPAAQRSVEVDVVVFARSAGSA